MEELGKDLLLHCLTFGGLPELVAFSQVSHTCSACCRVDAAWASTVADLKGTFFAWRSPEGPVAENSREYVHRAMADLFAIRVVVGPPVSNMNLQRALRSSSPASASPLPNISCAHCTSSVNVTWSVWNVGIVVCLECAGVLRSSVGVHLASIRHLTMDQWTAAQAARVLIGGNASFRAYIHARGLTASLLHAGRYTPHNNRTAEALYTQLQPYAQQLELLQLRLMERARARPGVT
jgi:hypothetical protein